MFLKHCVCAKGARCEAQAGWRLQTGGAKRKSCTTLQATCNAAPCSYSCCTEMYRSPVRYRKALMAARLPSDRFPPRRPAGAGGKGGEQGVGRH